jgi:hypothetical protein
MVKAYVTVDGVKLLTEVSEVQCNGRAMNLGIIGEIGFPALDAGSKDAAKMSIKLHPEAIRLFTQAASLNKPVHVTIESPSFTFSKIEFTDACVTSIRPDGILSCVVFSAVKSPRDAATGQASGKRSHLPVRPLITNL